MWQRNSHQRNGETPVERRISCRIKSLIQKLEINLSEIRAVESNERREGSKEQRRRRIEKPTSW